MAELAGSNVMFKIALFEYIRLLNHCNTPAFGAIVMSAYCVNTSVS